MGDTGEGFGADELVGDGRPRWSALLERVCRAVPGACAIHHLDGGRASSVLYQCSADPALLERWSSHLRRSEATRAALRAGEAVKVGLAHARGKVHALAAPLHVDHGIVSLVHFRRAEPHGPAEDTRLESLLDGLRRAWKVEQHLQQLRLERDRARAALDLAPLALVIVDAGGQVVHANRLALALVAEDKDTLRIEAGRVTAARAPDAARLRQAVKSTLSGRAPSATVSLTRTTRKRPLVVTVKPLPDDPDAVLLLVTDPEAPPVAAETLQTLFSLTAAEGRLAAALMAGHTLDACAAEFGTSVHTVRSQLRRLFQKTQTSRQSELVRLLAGAVRGL